MNVSNRVFHKNVLETFLCFLAKVILLGGSSNRIEILQPASNSSCVSPIRSPDYSVGGFISNQSLLLCNTNSYERNCMKFNNVYDLVNMDQSEKPIFYKHLVSKTRVNASAISVDSKLWIVGGQGMDTSEVISVDPKGSTPGSFSTHKIHNQHCILRVNSTTVMSTGGYHGNQILKDTWYSHVTSDSPAMWTWNNRGPNLNRRKQHSCLTWNFKGQTYFIVIGGQGKDKLLSTVMYLKLGTNSWLYGKSFD